MTGSVDGAKAEESPHLIVILDGAPFDVVRRAHERGGFRLFHPPVPVISCYPSMTDLALAEAFGAGPCLGVEALYFDRAKSKLSNANTVYLSGANAPWTPRVDYRCSTAWDAMAYLAPRWVFNHEIRGIARAFRKVESGRAIGYSVGTAGLGTCGGEKAIFEYLEVVDRLCEGVVERRGGKIAISLFADHGHNLTRGRRVSFRKLLEKAGYRWAKSIADPKRDVVCGEFGLVTCAALATADPKGVADVLLEHDAVDLVYYPRDADTVIIRGPKTEARVTMGPAGPRYEQLRGDPLQLAAIVERLSSTGHVAEDGGIDADAMFAATAHHEYPDPLARLWRTSHGLVQHPPDLMVDLHDEYCHGSRFFNTMAGDPASTHGSLNRANSTAFAMTTRGPLPGALRMTEVLGALEGAGM